MSKWDNGVLTRNCSLTPRAENIRDVRHIPAPVQFSLDEIKQHSTGSMDEVKAQFAVADKLNAVENEIACKMIWRSQVVLAEGLLDFYIHEISKYCLVRMFSGSWPKTEKYKSFQIPMEKVENAIAAVKSHDWFFRYLNDRFSRDVFLSCDSMRDQLNLIGIGFKAVMVKAFPANNDHESIKNGGKIIAELFQRRNEIAHQNDRSHASAVQIDISKDFVEDYILKVESIVNAIHQIAEEKETIYAPCK